MQVAIRRGVDNVRAGAGNSGCLDRIEPETDGQATGFQAMRAIESR